jgi:hypothetical protein
VIQVGCIPLAHQKTVISEEQIYPHWTVGGSEIPHHHNNHPANHHCDYEGDQSITYINTFYKFITYANILLSIKMNTNIIIYTP